MAEHVPGAPVRYHHGWIPVDAVDKTRDGSGGRLLDRLQNEAAAKTAVDWSTRNRDASGNFAPINRQKRGIKWSADFPQTQQDWSELADKSGQNLSFPVHRGMKVFLNDDEYSKVTDESRPMSERAHALVSAMQSREPNLGASWTDRQSKAEDVATDNGWSARRTPPPGMENAQSMPVVVSIAPPSLGAIETDDNVLNKKRIGVDDDEVPLSTGAPIDITGVSWKDGGWGSALNQSHTFDTPVKATA